MKKSKLWGIGMILCGFWFLATQLQLIPEIPFFKGIFSLWLGYILLRAIPKRNAWGILMPIAFLYKLWQETFGWYSLTWYQLLGTTVLFCIGLSLLFPRQFFLLRGVFDSPKKQQGDLDSAIRLSFGQRTEYLHTDDFSKGTFSVVFSSMTLYFDQCSIPDKAIHLDTDVVFGKLTIFVPSNFTIASNLTTVFSRLDIHGAPVDPVHTLTIDGEAVFGTVTVVYI